MILLLLLLTKVADDIKIEAWGRKRWMVECVVG